MSARSLVPMGEGIFDPLPRDARYVAARASDAAGAADWAADSAQKEPAGNAAMHPRSADPFIAPAVRDLAWLMRSPSLLSKTVFAAQMADPFDRRYFGEQPAMRMQALLHWLDKDPQALTEALTVAGERRLGRYAERLLAAWLQYAGGIEVTATSLPVREAGRTLGECDALFRTASGSFEHWELAVKFYLRVNDASDDADLVSQASSAPVPAFSEADRDRVAPGRHHGDGVSSQRELPFADPRFDGCDAYVGAGLADRFDWKLRRLVEHQLPLSGHPELLALAPGPWQARMFVKGRLFYPLASWRDPVPTPGKLPAALAIDHPRGWWATWDDWLAWSATAQCHWTSLARLDWLAPLRVDGSRARDAGAFSVELQQHFAPGAPSASVSRQVAALMLSPDGQSAHELSRGFIVPNEWPERARRFRCSGH